MSKYLFYGYKNPYGIIKADLTWTRLQFLLGLEKNMAEFNSLQKDIIDIRNKRFTPDEPNADRRFKIFSKIEKELLARHPDLFRGQHGQRVTVKRKQILLRKKNEGESPDMVKTGNRDSEGTPSNLSTATVSGSEGSGYRPASTVSSSGRQRMRPFVLLTPRKKRKSSNTSDQNSSAPPQLGSVRQNSIYTAGTSFSAISEFEPFSRTSEVGLSQRGTSSLPSFLPGKSHYAAPSGDFTKWFGITPHKSNGHDTLPQSRKKPKSAINRPEAAAHGDNMPGYPDYTLLDSEFLYRMTPERDHYYDPFDKELHRVPPSLPSFSPLPATPPKNFWNPDLPKHLSSTKNTNTFQYTPQSVNSDLARPKESGIAGIHRFLSKCNPPMMQHVRRFVDFGCSTTEYLRGVSRWPPEQRHKLLLKILEPVPGEMIQKMDIAVLEAQFEMYFANDDEY